MTNKSGFFASIRQNLFDGTLTQQQVDGTNAILETWAGYCSNAAPGWIAYSLATAFHETGRAMQPVTENLTYSSAAHICEVWPSRFSSPDDASECVRDPETLANRVYAGRGGNGDSESGDGFKFRGRGLVQLTFRDNYDKFGSFLNLPLVANPDLANKLASAATILVVGMTKGMFTGKSLANYTDWNSQVNYIAARAIINGNDRAMLIAGYAAKFQRALAV